MIKLVNAGLAFMAVLHPAPFQHSARFLHANTLFFIHIWNVTVLTAASRIIDQYKIVEKKGKKELVVRLVSESVGKDDDEVQEENDSSGDGVHDIIMRL